MDHKEIPSTVEGKLDEIILHLRKMDKRDRSRMIGSTIKTVITLIPLILLVVSTWYFAFHWKDIMKEMTNMAASSAANYTQQQSQGFFDQILNQYGIPKK